MANYPTIEGSIVTGKHEVNAYNHIITMPSSVAVTDHVLVIFVIDVSASYESYYTTIYSSTGTWNINSSYRTPSFEIDILIGHPTTGGSIALTVAYPELQMSTYIAMRISALNTCDLTGIHSGVDHFIENYAYDTSTDANPPGIATIDAGLQFYLAIAVAAFAGILTASAAPATYTGFTTEVATSAENNSLAFAYVQAAFTGNNPGVFTSASAYWVALNMMMYPQIACESINLLVKT